MPNEMQTREDETVYRALVGSLPERMVVITHNSRIVATNLAWDQFGRENGNPDLVQAGVGDSYVAAMNEDDPEYGAYARRAREGISDVLCGARPDFELTYPCVSIHGETWWETQVFPVTQAEGLFVVIHRDRTEYHRLREALRQEKSGKQASPKELPDLAPRQRQVLELIAKGFSNREIALTMGITMKTVDYHIKTLKLKLATTRRVQLIYAGAALLAEKEDSATL